MLIGWLYFIVIILANTVGSLSGMGGGVIIKPVLDAIGAHSVGTISFYSSIAVFTMAIVSTIKQVKNGVTVKPKTVLFLSLGSVLGGIIGNVTFEGLLRLYSDEQVVQKIQISLTIVSLLFAILYTHYKWSSWQLIKVHWYFSAGLFLGFLATLLGIGGGPINVALLMLCFGFPIKEATVYSIVTILFSQFSKLIATGLSTGYQVFDLNLLSFIIPAAIFGGFLGAQLSGILSDKRVLQVYQFVVVAVIGLNLWNLF
ncbi:sulfite exporter TauE/SafE family protein [Carnobacterium maltaromaticum]|uniref:sulfite exporter TauE/SafE family protein n=1 Tax=Carnobacterium maltaromaticum TaxID=2751 RepID=UPI0039AFC771